MERERVYSVVHSWAFLFFHAAMDGPTMVVYNLDHFHPGDRHVGLAALDAWEIHSIQHNGFDENEC